MILTPLDSLVARVRGEYCEMPGLGLTVSQACRQWHIDVSTCEMLFEYRATDDSQTNLTAARARDDEHIQVDGCRDALEISRP